MNDSPASNIVKKVFHSYSQINKSLKKSNEGKTSKSLQYNNNFETSIPQSDIHLENSKDFGNDIPCRWLVGDIVWTKYSAYPWWPSMIIYDPNFEIHTRIKKKYREYHVQFFGENARAWVHDKYIKPFEQVMSYQKFLEAIGEGNTIGKTPKSGKKKKKIDGSEPEKVQPEETNNKATEPTNLPNSFDLPSTSATYDSNKALNGKSPNPPQLSDGVPPRFRTLWTKGLAIAERALPLSRYERKQTLTVDFPSPPPPYSSSTTNNINNTLLINNPISNHDMPTVTPHPPKQKRKRSKKAEDKIRDEGIFFKLSNISFTDNQTSEKEPLPKECLATTETDTSLLEASNKVATEDTTNMGHTEPSTSPSPNNAKRARKMSSKFAEYNLTSLVHSSAKKINRPNEEGGDPPSKIESSFNNVKSTQNELEANEDTNKIKSIKSDPDGKVKSPRKSLPHTESARKHNHSNIDIAKSAELKRAYLTNSSGPDSQAIDSPITAVKSETSNDSLCDDPPKQNNNNDINNEPTELDSTKTNNVIFNIISSSINELCDDKKQMGNLVNQAKTSSYPILTNSTQNTDKSTNNTFPHDKYYICLTCKQIEPAKIGSQDSTTIVVKKIDPDAILKCITKGCGNTYHRKCLVGLPVSGPNALAPDTFKCVECVTGKKPCLICKSFEDPCKYENSVPSNELISCMLPTCGKTYHKSCINRYPLTVVDTAGFVCPRHQCATCISETSYTKNPRASKGKFYNCILCPCTYHSNKECLSAGSFILSDTSIVCSDHNQPEHHLNVGWCFICSKGEGNDLVCCDSCPAAFHQSCLPDCLQIPAQGVWWCPDCEAGRRPVFGDIVWVKLSSYRWWPGRVCNPDSVPYKVRIKASGDCLADLPGQFPVYFFGSGDYYWINRTRVFLFADGDRSATKESTNSQGKSLNKTFAKALQEAAEEFEQRKQRKLERLKIEQSRQASKKFRPFKMIKVNKPYIKDSSTNHIINHSKEKDDDSNSNAAQQQLDPHILLRDLHACNCDPNGPAPCSDDSVCLNRISLIECHPKVCRAGDRCQNQRFVKRAYPPAKPFLTKDRGWGLMTLAPINRGDFVYEYVGELVDEAECRRRIEIAYRNNIEEFYFLTLDKDRIIDAGPKGNLSRFMNHNCAPNLESQKWTVNGDIRVGLFAIKDIAEGEELTFNYNLDSLGNEKKQCKCGASVCSGFMGVRPLKKAPSNNNTNGFANSHNSNATAKDAKNSQQSSSGPTTPQGRKISSRVSSNKGTLKAPRTPNSLLSQKALLTPTLVNNSGQNKKIQDQGVNDLSASQQLNPNAETPKSTEIGGEVVLQPQKNFETECFVCGDVGELISCASLACPKVYHITCVNLNHVPPPGRWTCPRHFCAVSECLFSQNSQSRDTNETLTMAMENELLKCAECTNSYCTNHKTPNVICLTHMPGEGETDKAFFSSITLCSTSEERHKEYIEDLTQNQKYQIG